MQSNPRGQNSPSSAVAFQSTATNQGYSVPVSATLPGAGDEITFMIFFNCSSTTAIGGGIPHLFNYASTFGVLFSGGQISTANQSSANNTPIAASNTIKTNLWTTVLVSRKAGFYGYSIDGGPFAFVSAAWSPTTPSGSLWILQSLVTMTRTAPCLAQRAAIWRRQLTDAEAKILHNNRASVGYGGLPPILLNGLCAWWEMPAASGVLRDRHGTNHGTQLGSPTTGPGVTPPASRPSALRRTSADAGRPTRRGPFEPLINRGLIRCSF